jgi:hypothetical protein
MEKATEKVLGDALRRRYRPPSELPQALKTLWEALRKEPTAVSDQSTEGARDQKADMPKE